LPTYAYTAAVSDAFEAATDDIGDMVVRWSDAAETNPHLLEYLQQQSFFGQQPQSSPGGVSAQRGFNPSDSVSRGSELPPELKEFLEKALKDAGIELDGKKNPLEDMSSSEMLQLLIDYLANEMHQREQQRASPPRNAGNMGGGQNFSRGQPASWNGGGGSSGGGSSGGGSTGGGTRTGGSTSTSSTLGPRSHGEKGIPDGLRTNAANGARLVREMGFDGTIGGIGERSGPSDHPHGNAIDVMTMNDTKSGREIAERFRADHEKLGVKYVIYQQQIASASSNWEWRAMEDRGSPTQNHMDHPHISFY
jgi:hypothetical protein